MEVYCIHLSQRGTSEQDKHLQEERHVEAHLGCTLSKTHWLFGPIRPYLTNGPWWPASLPWVNDSSGPWLSNYSPTQYNCAGKGDLRPFRDICEKCWPKEVLCLSCGVHRHIVSDDWVLPIGPTHWHQIISIGVRLSTWGASFREQ